MEKIPEKNPFEGVRRLYGDEAYGKIQSSHVMVIGVGGVGSWSVESLARSGVGAITLVDFDDICISNSNRQIHALAENIGRQKTEVLKERINSINPYCKVTIVENIVSQDNVFEILKEKYSCVLDCIDQGHNKLYLIAACRELNLPVVVAGGAGGLTDPSRIKIADLSQTREDGMLSNVRKWLRRKYNFPRGDKKFGIPAIYSEEKRQFVDSCGKPTFDRPEVTDGGMDCQNGFGTTMTVTATVGLFAAAEAIKIISK